MGDTFMKRLALISGMALAALIFVPGSVSAHGIGDDEGGNDSWSNAQTTDWQADGEQNDWQEESNDDTSNDTSNGTIVDALVADGNFTTLVAAVQAAGLAETLSAPGDLTVFAPTDEAFANLPAGTVESLLANPGVLADVLKNHVVAGRVDSDAAVMYGEAQALSGNTLNIGYGDDGELYIEDSRITMADIETSNGIVHVIDAVLVPTN
jgi:uncharacterized surface protein with fasciclin (FAS1) repeats